QLRAWADEVRSGFTAAMYYLMKRPEPARPLIEPLLDSNDPQQSWRAATIVAMWEDSRAEPRLIQAVRSREYGFDEAPEKERPESFNRAAPNWIVAVTLLRCCGTPACLDDLLALASDRSLVHGARTALALTLAALAMRLDLPSAQKTRIADALRMLLA